MYPKRNELNKSKVLQTAAESQKKEIGSCACKDVSSK
jgi:hypothetical protein